MEVHPPYAALSWRGLDSIKLAYNPCQPNRWLRLTANAFNRSVLVVGSTAKQNSPFLPQWYPKPSPVPARSMHFALLAPDRFAHGGQSSGVLFTKVYRTYDMTSVVWPMSWLWSDLLTKAVVKINVLYVRYDQLGHRDVTVYISIHGYIQCFSYDTVAVSRSFNYRFKTIK